MKKLVMITCLAVATTFSSFAAKKVTVQPTVKTLTTDIAGMTKAQALVKMEDAIKLKPELAPQYAAVIAIAFPDSVGRIIERAQAAALSVDSNYQVAKIERFVRTQLARFSSASGNGSGKKLGDLSPSVN